MEETKINVGEGSVQTSISDIRDHGYPDGVSVYLAIYDDSVGVKSSIFMSPNEAEILGTAILAAAAEVKRRLKG